MGRRQVSGGVAEEAARIFVEEALTDYGMAKRKAAERLGLPARSGLPDNLRIQEQVLAYQRLFGGAQYVQQLHTLRQTAVQAMHWLKDFSPRLVGAVVSGAISDAHRIQLHAFPEKPELVDTFLSAKRVEMQADERDYRWPDGRSASIPLARFDAPNGIGIDVALFGPEDRHRAPCSPVDGKPVKRLTLEQAEALARVPIAVL